MTAAAVVIAEASSKAGEDAIIAQRAVYSPLPAEVFIKVRDGLMWATSVSGDTCSRDGPRETNRYPGS
ncbi:MAG: hypothetical protein J0H06_03190 [Actinobacteria bacterium]|nr:hypothetical protein [Actinomycetota bacterium]MBS1893275.1 hypothetical protein [Actinomycetota bacterium]